MHNFTSFFEKNEVDGQVNFPSPSPSPRPVHSISGSFSQPPRSTLSITEFAIQLRKHQLGTKLNVGLMLTWCFLLFSARHQRITPFSFSLRPVHIMQRTRRKIVRCIKRTFSSLKKQVKIGYFTMVKKCNRGSNISLNLPRHNVHYSRLRGTGKLFYHVFPTKM